MDSVRFYNKGLTDFSLDDSGRTVVVGALNDEEIMNIITSLEAERNQLTEEVKKYKNIVRTYDEIGALSRWIVRLMGFDFDNSDVKLNKQQTIFCGICDVVFLNKGRGSK